MGNGRLQFFNLVKEMREAQKDYFSTHSYAALRKAQRLERQVDQSIRRGDAYLLKQTEHPTLFDEQKS